MAPSRSRRLHDLPARAAFAHCRDEYNAAYLSFVLLGSGFLFPWDAVITAVGFFQDTRGFGPEIEFDFSTTYMVPNLCGLLFAVKYGARFSFRNRIVLGFSIFLACIGALPFITSRTAAVALVGVIGFADAVVQGSIYGLAGQFHPRYVGAVMSGNGVAGVTVCLLRILTKAVVPASYKNAGELSAGLYFGLSAIVILACILVYAFVLEKARITKFYLAKTPEERMQYITQITRSRTNMSTASAAQAYMSGAQASAAATSYGLSMAHDAPDGAGGGGGGGGGGEGSDDPEAAAADATAVAEADALPLGPVAVFAKLWPDALTVALNFLITLALFPGITSQMTSPNFCYTTGWFPIILITLFNAFDFIGRTAPRWDALIFVSPRWLPAATALRVVFVPLFIMCMHHVGLTSDMWAYASMIGMALTNGYFGTLAMMYGPERVGVKDKEQAGTVMVFFLTAGLTSGVWTGVLLNGFYGLQGTAIHGGTVYTGKC